MKSVKHKINLWKKADIEAVRRPANTFRAAHSAEIMQIMNDLVPSRWPTTRYNHVFMSREASEHLLPYGTEMPELVPSPDNAMPPIDIHVKGAGKLLRGFKDQKATGADEVVDRLLKEATDQLVPRLITIFMALYQLVTDIEE